MTQSSTSTVHELTVRSVVLGGLITLVFTAANVYLGLKVGLTFATAIPAAVTFGVVFAGIVAASGSDAPPAIVGEGVENWGVALGIVLFVVTVLALYRAARRAAADRTV
jgi:hypothetical protein